MSAIRRPLSVTILAGVYIAVGAIGFAFHFSDLRVSPIDGMWVELTELLAVLCGLFMLRGHNWARWTALAWMAFHVVVSAFHTFKEFAMHALICAVIAWLLLSSRSARYFRGARIRSNVQGG